MEENRYGYTSTWQPRVVMESSSGYTSMDLLDIHLKHRKIFLTGEVMNATAIDFVSKIMFLAQEKEPIDIYLDSPGGMVDAGLIIYDVLQSLDGVLPINIYCIGMAASMGAVILAGGQKGRRYILPHGRVMIHEPLISGGMGGSATSIKKTAESILKTKATTNGLLAKHTGKTVEEIDEATGFDNYMSAEEAVEFGLADEIRNLF